MEFSNKDKSIRAHCSLIGLSVGDAFGEQFFGYGEDTLVRIENMMVPEAPVWKWTDDTAMAISIVNTLDKFGTIEQDYLVDKFAQHFRNDPHRGYGGGAYGLLTSISKGRCWKDLSKAMFNGTGSLGNGSAMRVAPLGAYFADCSYDKVAEEAKKSSEVTHTHPQGIVGAVSVAIAAAYIGNMVSKPFNRNEFFATILDNCPSGLVREGIDNARQVQRMEIKRAALMLGNGSKVSAADTVPFCIWIVGEYGIQYEKALWATVYALGDRDTTCAIVGGIIGSSADAVVPEEWVRRTERLK